jgi:hypothetical protein
MAPILALLEEVGELPAGQKPVAYAVAITMLAVSLELVRRRKLREEHALVWVITAGLLLLLAWQHRLLDWFTGIIGARSPVSALFFGAVVFLMLLCLQFSVRLSKLTFRQRTLTQEIALLREQVERALPPGEKR